MKMIACVDKKTLRFNNNGKNIFYCKEDIEFFRSKTLGKIVVMGAATYDTIGLLKGRLNIVITSHPNKYKSSTDDAIFVYLWQAYRLLKNMRNSDDVYIIGGRMLYSAFIDFCDEIILTEVNTPSKFVDGYDSYFPNQIRDNKIWKRGRCIKSFSVPYKYLSKGKILSKPIWFRVHSYKRIKNT